MNNRPFNARSDVAKPKSEPGMGDDVPCVKCGATALDTGLECDECGHDNWETVTGRPRGSAASQEGGGVDASTDGAVACRKCGGSMKPGKAMAQTVGCSDEGTCSPAGPGALIDCMKCERCGWSVTAGVQGDAAWRCDEVMTGGERCQQQCRACRMPDGARVEDGGQSNG